MQSFVRARVRVCVVLLIYSYPRRKCVQHSTCSSNFLAEYVEIQIKEPCNRMHRHAPCITVVLWEGMQGPMQMYPQEHSPRPIFHLTLKKYLRIPSLTQLSWGLVECLLHVVRWDKTNNLLQILSIECFRISLWDSFSSRSALVL